MKRKLSLVMVGRSSGDGVSHPAVSVSFDLYGLVSPLLSWRQTAISKARGTREQPGRRDGSYNQGAKDKSHTSASESHTCNRGVEETPNEETGTGRPS